MPADEISANQTDLSDSTVIRPHGPGVKKQVSTHDSKHDMNDGNPNRTRLRVHETENCEESKHQKTDDAHYLCQQLMA